MNLSTEQQLALGHFAVSLKKYHLTNITREKDYEIKQLGVDTVNTLRVLGLDIRESLELIESTIKYVCSKQGENDLYHYFRNLSIWTIQ